MAYGDQPSLILEQIEWARLNGFQVVCAGKGTKYHPSFEYSTPDTVWGHYGLTKERAEKDYKVYKERQIAQSLKNKIVDQDQQKKRRMAGKQRHLLSNTMSTEVYGTNWPYDYFSLVETIKLDVKIKVGE